MPTPEQVGIGAGASPDWQHVHDRLHQLGALCFRWERRPQGGFRVSCLVPSGRAGLTHHIEAEAVNEADALRLALQKAEDRASR